MKTITILLLVAAIAAAYGSAPFRIEPSPVYTSHVPIVRFSQEIGPGSDNVSYETADGTMVDDNTQIVAGRKGRYEDAEGRMVETDSSVVKRGQYTYLSPDGHPITVKWEADEHGYRAEGDSLPVVAPLEPLPVRLMQSTARR